MSYILEALKKSDQQRQRGTTPTLQATQMTVLAPQRPMFLNYGLLALVLLAAGITIGWLRPWQPQHMPVIVEPVAPPQQAAPAALPTPVIPVADVAQPYKPVRAADQPVAATPVQDKPAGIAQDDQTILLSELPPHIQLDIPAMEVQLHAYSSVPGERLVSINSIRLREGGSLMPGLRLEQITPDGMIFSYKGYRFRRGVR